MKLAVENENAVVVGAAETGAFHIKASPKAFSILSSGLYSDKILAVVRELSCNAYDSHVEAGHPDKPFTVHLPHALSPEFFVRDYGVGLDHEGVMNVYTTYFESTKQDSNDYIGALGLGSKSPFSYTTNFTIVAIKDGVRRVYSALMEDGIPNIVKFGDDEQTKEANSVEVKFAVNKSDFYNFEAAAKKVFQWFDVQPEFAGNKITVAKPDFKHVQIVPGVDIRANAGWRSTPLARQGNVVYPIKPNDEFVDEDLRSLLEIPLVIDFPIGDLDVAASREELSYIDHTHNSINRRLREIQDGLVEYAKKQITEATTDWERALIVDDMRDDTFKDIIDTILASGKLFDTLDVKFSHGQTRLNWDVSDQYTISGYSAGVRNHSTGEVRLTRLSPEVEYNIDDKTNERVESRRYWTPDITRVLFFLNDTGKKNVLGRVREYYKQNGGTRANAYVIAPVENGDIGQAKLDLAGAPIIKCSTLPDSPRITTSTTASTKITLLKLKHGSFGDGWRSVCWKWDLITQSLADASKGKRTLFVPLKNRTVLHGEHEMDSDTFYHMLDKCVKAGLIKNDIVVYGVRKSVIADLPKEYFNLFDELRRKLTALQLQQIQRKQRNKSAANVAGIPSGHLNYIKDRLDSNHIVSPLAVAVNEGSDKAAKSFDVENLQKVASMLNSQVDLNVADAAKEGVDLWLTVIAKYPLLALISVSSRVKTKEAQSMIDYIQMVDKAEETTDS